MGAGQGSGRRAARGCQVRAAIAACLTSVLLGAGGAWWVQDMRYGLELQRIAAQAQIEAGKRKDNTIAKMGEHMEGFTDALQQFQQTNQRNEAAAAGLARVLVDLRGVTSGLRADTGAMRAELAKLPLETVRKYADTCTVVFERMAAGGERLAAAGARIARPADGHAADSEMMQRAWPK